MSYTTIYVLHNGTCKDLSNFQNAWLSAFTIWQELFEKYQDGERAMTGKEELNKAIVSLADEDLTESERAVLLSTYDRCVLAVKDRKWMAECMRTFATERPDVENTLLLQAQALQDADVPEDAWFAWQQTSCGEFWAELEEDEYTNPNNPEAWVAERRLFNIREEVTKCLN